VLGARYIHGAENYYNSVIFGGTTMKKSISRLILFVCAISALFMLQNCGKNNFLWKKAIPLLIEEVDSSEIQGTQPNDPNNPGVDPGTKSGKDGPITLKPVDGLHPIFSAPLGSSIPSFSMGVVDADPTGLSAVNDWDGDGIPNDLEVMSSSLVADYPRIVTRITTPILMELRKSETTTSENYTETIENTDTKETISNSMENKHYAQMNQRTTPYVVKGSQSTDNSDAYSYGDSSSSEYSFSVNVGFPISATAVVQNGASTSTKQSKSQNWSISNRFAQSTMSEKTVFQDVDYVDNLDRNGIEIKDEKVQSMSTNFRNSEKTKEAYEVGPNAGYVRAGLYIKNDTVNMPVRVSNVVCTLSFNTAGGAILPVKTFRLRNDDYSEFDQEVYGGEELGPFTIEVTGLNTYEVKQAMRNGYMPQITVVSYDMHRVEDSNYNPGVDNLKIVEETAKSRTALIKIVGTNTRDIYRVAAFDIDIEQNISPGISLKKALYNIFSDRIGKGESWATDKNGKEMTVPDAGLKWKEGFVPGPDGPSEYKYSSNKKGNSWRLFETYIKFYTDEYNQTHRIETIKRIGALNAYNPFSTIDNPSYNPNEFLEREELMKMKYWIILHNGRYFEGDINDPIWAGERYEIVCMDIRDFNEYFKTYSFTPVQSMEYFKLDTSWNRLNNCGEFARAKYLGRLVKSDVVHLELNLSESRFLFDGLYDRANRDGKPAGDYTPITNDTAREWYSFNYTLQPNIVLPQGIPSQFSHYAEGGFNNIKVTINESKNAREYEISFKEKDDTSSPWKKVIISADELKINNGEVFITSLTKDVDGNPIGLITGRLLSSGGLEYTVNVKAYGLVNSIPVYTWSMTNNKDEAVAAVYNADSTSAPGGKNGFTFSAAALGDNWVYIRIADADYTEYYKVRVIGPYNYSYNGNNLPLNDNTAPIREFIGHRGLNKIQLPNPPGEIKEDGIYKVIVYGINNNCITGGLYPRQAENDCVFVSIAHDRYAAQRMYKPQLNNSLFKMNAIDLEVNFNDGNGWYRLKLEPGDMGDQKQREDKRIIDCRFNSFVDYDSQKFHIFFKPPCGVYDDYSKYFAGNNDVFAGGREVVDLYIRTAAEQRYRDTFWMKDQASDMFDESMNYVVTPPTVVPTIPTDLSGVFSYFINYWVNSDITDASSIENSLASNKVVAGPSYNPDMGIGFKGTELQNYFFSPLEYRKFDIRASLVEKLPQQQNYVVDPPKFYASGGPSCIQVVNIESQFATYYEVYYKLVNPNQDPGEPLIAPDENPLNWNFLKIEEGKNLNWLNLRDITIPIYAYNQRYIVAVIGYNMYGRSEPSYFDGYDGITAKTGDTDNRARVTSVFVYNGTPPVVAPTITATNNASNVRQIDVSVSGVSEAVRYYIEWKESQEDWGSATRFDTFADGQTVLSSVNYTISQHHGLPIRAWKTYTIRAAGVTLDSRPGTYSNVVSVVTGTDFTFSPGNLAWNNIQNVGDGITGIWSADLILQNISLPGGTTRYRINISDITHNLHEIPTNTELALHGSFSLPKPIDNINVTNIIADVINIPNDSATCTLITNDKISERWFEWGQNYWNTESVDLVFTITAVNENNDEFTSKSFEITISKPENVY
jgi:hypothetical protein